MHATGLSESLGRAVVEAEQCVHIWLGVEHFRFSGRSTVPTNLTALVCLRGLWYQFRSILNAILIDSKIDLSKQIKVTSLEYIILEVLGDCNAWRFEQLHGQGNRRRHN